MTLYRMPPQLAWAIFVGAILLLGACAQRMETMNPTTGLPVGWNRDQDLRDAYAECMSGGFYGANQQSYCACSIEQDKAMDPALYIELTKAAYAGKDINTHPEMRRIRALCTPKP